MPYTKKISTHAPGLILLVLDDSGSMSEPLPGTQDAKHEWVNRLTGLTLQELLQRCTEIRDGVAVVKPRYHFFPIPYGSTPQAWGPAEIDIQAILQRCAQNGNSLGLGGNLGNTDTAAALQLALQYLTTAVAQERFKTSFPPMVFHLTDGQSQTDAAAVAEQIKQLKTADGSVLVVNVFIGAHTSLPYQGPDDFPGYVTEAEAGPGSESIQLWRMSSIVPETIRTNLIERGIFPKLRPGARLFFDVRTRELLAHAIQVVGSIEVARERQVAGQP
jgi:hypothetical protein